MKKRSQGPTDPGKNVTGTGSAPIQSKRTERGAQAGSPRPNGHEFEELHTTTHVPYVLQGDPIGTMPRPSSITGAAKTVVDKIKGRDTTVLLDRIGERLAFERTGTRLYELVLLKYDLRGTWDGGPSRADLEEIHADELRHFNLLADAMRELGGDPTAMTPGADVTAVESLGIQQVVADPRTSMAQALHAMQVAELADRDGWELLIDVTETLGQTALAARFRIAANDEVAHLTKVRAWNKAFVIAESKVGEQPTLS